VEGYYGIPLFNSEGKILGTVCHFDSTPVRVTEDVATVLDDLVPLITEAAFIRVRTPIELTRILLT
jgi:hypothetical protein